MAQAIVIQPGGSRQFYCLPGDVIWIVSPLVSNHEKFGNPKHHYVAKCKVQSMRYFEKKVRNRKLVQEVEYHVVQCKLPKPKNPDYKQSSNPREWHSLSEEFIFDHRPGAERYIVEKGWILLRET